VAWRVSASAPGGAAALLEQLQVPRQRVLYVQASADWIQRAGLGAAEMLAALLEWTGSQGTLVMPSYPFHSTHQQYLEGHPSYDVRRTPAGIGLLPEMFRRTAGAVRSLDPDFCVSALGADAEAIAGTEPSAPDPFGSASSYQRMLNRHATLVGLGVSLNTNSFVHLIDSRAEAGYPAPVYEDRLVPAQIVEANGRSREVLRRVLRPQFQQRTTPSAIAHEMQPATDVFVAFEINGAIFFRWDLDAWSSWCLAHANRQAAAGAWPCWLRLLGTVEATPLR
jgi:aminoglycoside N3'-acetyltransferase